MPLTAPQTSRIRPIPPPKEEDNRAAKSAFDLLGAGENLLWYWRHGTHYHEIIDVQTLAGVINHKKYGTPLPERIFDVPFDTKIIE